MQVQDVQGETSEEAPMAIVLPKTTQVASWSRHGVRSSGGSERQGTRGLRKLCGRSKTERVTSPMVSEFSQMRRASATLRISANWASVKRPAWLPFSYQNRSQRLQNEPKNQIFYRRMKMINLPQTAELIANDASESRSYQTALERSFNQTTGPQINIVYGSVDLFEAFDNLGRHFSAKIFECGSSFQVASRPVFVVWSQSVIAAALDVESSQIETGERHSFGLEEMVGDLASHKLIQIFHRRNKEASSQFVDGLNFHKHFRVEESGA